MNSIRRQLTMGLLLGFAVILGLGGVILFLKTREMLLRGFDAALSGKAQALAGAIKQEGDKLEIEFRDETLPSSGRSNLVEFFQVRILEGAVVKRSRSLGKAELPWELGSMTLPVFRDVVLPNGERGRAVGVHFIPRLDRRGKTNVVAPEMGLVLAHVRGPLDASIRNYGGLQLLTAGLTALAVVALVSFVLRRGLAPLDRLATEAEKIDATTLGQRFPTENLPAEIKPICSRLNDLLSRLECSFNDIREYAAKVAHELRTPLTILRLKLDQAGDRLPPELAEELHGEMHHLTHVIEQSLLIARAEHGRLQVEPAPFDLGRLVADLVEDFSLLAEDSGRAVNFTPPALCLATADAKHTRQIVHNLLTNALKHGCGDVSIRLTSIRGRRVLTIWNEVRRDQIAGEEPLGLGLRVVASLLHLQPTVKFTRRHGRRYHAARLSFPAATPPGRDRSPFPLAGPAADPV